MKKRISSIIAVVLVVMLLTQVTAFAGIIGYEGGITKELNGGKTDKMVYTEVCFLTGEPIVFTGTLTIKTSSTADTYTYDLKSTKTATDTIKRTVTITNKKTKESDKQTSEVSTISKPTEVVKIGSTTYTLKTYNFSKSTLTDDKPAVDYYSGNLIAEKIYQVGSTTTNMVVETTGNIYGYQQYWGTAEVQKLQQTISEQVYGTDTAWKGTVDINITSGLNKKMEYSKNEPEVISFEGGFFETEQNTGILDYTARLPEFDSKGNATDYILDYHDTLKLDGFPTKKSLKVSNIYQMKGHWAEQYVKEIYSLKIFDEDENKFNPEEYVTKLEFIAAMVNAVNNMNGTTTKTTTTTTTKSTKVISPFTDLDVKNKYFSKINDALKMGLINGKGDGTLGANEYLTLADTLTIFVNALGLESIAPGENPVTYFNDNDKIPQYARRPAYIAQKIGLIKGDDNGNLNPTTNITKAQAATLISRFLEYLRQDIRKDYKDRVVG